MIDTSFSTRRIADRLLSRRSRAPLGRTTRSSAIAHATVPARRRLASQAGDTLIEVIVSALLVGLIVVGTFSGLDSTNKATALQRSRSQADALAEQNEEQLRSEPIKKLYELESHPKTETVKEGKTTYTIETSAAYIADSTATASCTSSAAQADYLQTTSKVTWPSLGVGKAVVETGVISPPASSAIIVQVSESGTPVQEAVVTATGPSPETTTHTLETSVNGCAILAVSPGEYALNATKTSYVDPNGYLKTEEDLSTTHSVYLAAETTAKIPYYLGLAGKIEVSFKEAGAATQGDSFVEYNSGQTKYRPFGAVGTYGTTVTSPTTIYPFKSKDTIYAGTCEADLPSANGVSLVPEEEKEVPRGGSVLTAVRLGPVKIKVMGGFSSKPGKEISGAAGYTEDTGCKTKRTFTTNSAGAMPHPGLPFGKYKMCVGSGANRWEGEFANNSVTGPTSTSWTNGGTSSGIATIYLGIEGTGTTPSGVLTGGTC
jgi:Tfp pilus assembly protein PilV